MEFRAAKHLKIKKESQKEESHRRKNHKICTQTDLRFLADPALRMHWEEIRNMEHNSWKAKKAQVNLAAMHHGVGRVWSLSPAKLEGLRKHLGSSVKIPDGPCRIKTVSVSQDKYNVLKQRTKLISWILSK